MAPGLDRIFQSDSCATSGDDYWITINNVDYNPTLSRSTIYLNYGNKLWTSEYRLIICDTLTSDQGVALDGDLDTNAGGDFILNFTVTVPPTITSVNSIQDTGDGMILENEITTAEITQLIVEFSQNVKDSAGNTDLDDVTNVDNYLLVEAGLDQTITTDMCGAVQGDDLSISINSVTYDNSSFISTLNISGSQPLLTGNYRLLVCKNIILEGLGNIPLDGNYDGIGGDDFVLDFIIDGAPEVQSINTVEDTGDGQLLAEEIATTKITQLIIEFDQAIYDPIGNIDADDVTNPNNYILATPGTDNTFQTQACNNNYGDDNHIIINNITYNSASYIATIDINNGVHITDNDYRLLVCANIQDTFGEKLDGDGNIVEGDDFIFNFTVVVAQLPPFSVNTTIEPGDGICGIIYCSLGEAILAANTTPELDYINFALSGTPPYTIQPSNALPEITAPVFLDGWSQSEFSGTPIIILDGTIAGLEANGLTISGGDSTVRGFVVKNFDGDGILFTTNGGNTVSGNYVGTDKTGTVAQENYRGIVIFNTVGEGNYIGGTTPQERNVISGNNYVGLWVITQNGNTIIHGNYVGIDITGTIAIPNGSNGVGAGVYMTEGNTLGGLNSGERNVISGNHSPNVFLDSGTHTIQGNFIGTDATGTIAIPNYSYGITGNSFATAIIDSNVISGNTLGIRISRGIVQNNHIGVDVTGTIPLGNSNSGMLLESNFPGIIVQNNIISSNGGHGIWLGSPDTTVQGNIIGTDITGTIPMGNSGNGIWAVSTNNIIGGTNPGEGNIIAYNGIDGIYVPQNENQNNIIGNTIFNNVQQGINLRELETVEPNVTLNDLNDIDDGGNNLQNYPVIDTVESNGSQVFISGSLNSTLNAGFRIDFFSNSSCDPSGYGEGEIYLGSVNVITDSTGNVSFSATFNLHVPSDYTISTTATDTNGNTSEFSRCHTIDTLLPSLPPTSLSLTPVSSNMIELSWIDNSLDETEFRIERSPDGVNNWEEIGITLADTITFTTDAYCESSYAYRVRAYRSDGNSFSDYSNIADSSTNLCPPSMLTAPIRDNYLVDLEWIDASSNESTFHIERSADTINWVEIDTVGINTTTFTDTSVDCDTTYHYRVYISGNGSYSYYSNIALATTGLCSPVLAVDYTLSDSVTLIWSYISTADVATIIERSTDGSIWTEITTTDIGITTTWTDENLDCETIYYYRARTYSEANTAYSNHTMPIQATTGVCSADLGVTASSSASVVEVGDTVRLFVTVLNTGPSSATNVQIISNLPDNLHYVDETSSPECDGTSQTVSCDVGTMHRDSTASVEIDTIAQSNSNDPIILDISVNADQPDPNEDNNGINEELPIVWQETISMTEQILFNLIQAEITNNSAIQDIEFVLVDIVSSDSNSGHLVMTVRTKDGILGEVTSSIELQDNIMLLQITSISVDGLPTPATYTESIYRELPILIVNSFDTLLGSFSEISTINFGNQSIDIEVNR